MPESQSPTAPSADNNGEHSTPSEEDFLRIFMARRQQMEALVQRRVRCKATAADLIQDLFLRFWKRPKQPIEALDSYLMRSARNLAIDHLRAEQARLRSLDHLEHLYDLPETSSIDHALQAREELQYIERALQALPERTRQIFLLNRVHGCTYADIAYSMNLSQSAVEKHMMRALNACKACLEQQYSDFAAPSGNPRS
ncbi:RNA polymerase sigma-70 factor (ECF subfamily) [Azomonas agilis]|uniref:RNA polymerase sigma-70 factor (ECF subfamily) n=1 Tax=Azomonas agilis TaxID=116849 RepID=A0A562IY80_9GAMM|nr:RNA polymerase sigma-70 factor (ECF subfamily) [Azomonas agilis]